MTIYRVFEMLLLAAIMIILTCSSISCTPTPNTRLVVLAADREIVALDSNYYRVSKLWLVETYEMNRRLLQSLEECNKYRSYANDK